MSGRLGGGRRATSRDAEQRRETGTCRWLVFSAGGQRKTDGGGGLRCQAGDEENLGLQRRGGSGRRVVGEG